LVYVFFFCLISVSFSAKYWLYAGAGGCDTDDPHCTNPPPIFLSTIYILDFDSANGNISLVNKQTGFSPQWLRVHPSRKFLFTVDSNGGVASLSVNANTGALTRINTVNTPGPTVYMDINPDGTMLFVASYSQGTISTFPIDPQTGQIGAMTSKMQFYGHGVNPARQEAPHPHSINCDPKTKGRYVFVPDLGLDTVFSFDVSTGMLKNDTYTNTTHTNPGAGPRHMAWHPTLAIAYVVDEMGSTVTVFQHDYLAGNLKMPALQVIDTLPEGFNGFNKAAEILIERTGKWLLVSNRGYVSPSNSITVYSVDENTGLLTETGRYPSGGTFPRGMELSPEGNVVVVGGQDTNNVVTMGFDPATGTLIQLYDLKDIATPITFAFIPQL